MNEKISIKEYNLIIEDDVTSIKRYLDKFLEINDIQISEIDSLFLTGGTSLVRSIQTVFKEKFPDTPIHTGDNFMSVAKGLALSGYLFDE